MAVTGRVDVDSRASDFEGATGCSVRRNATFDGAIAGLFSTGIAAKTTTAPLVSRLAPR